MRLLFGTTTTALSSVFGHSTVAIPAKFAGFWPCPAVYDGMSRAEAAKVGGMDRQTLERLGTTASTMKGQTA